MSMVSMIDRLDQPMVFMLKDGGLFKVNSFKSHFTTEFFLITQVNDSENCVTLMLLRPCNLCCDQTVLMPMDECITIDMSCFCGYQPISNVCIRACNHPPIRLKDCICGRFTMLPENDGVVLWQSNLVAEQSGSINLYIEKGKEEPLTLRLYFNDSNEYKVYQLMGKASYKFSLTNCSFIKIVKADKMAKVQGSFEIELEHVIESLDI